MKAKWVSIGLFSVLAALPIYSWAGVNSSGGGDRFAADFGSAWFTGPGKPIPTCLVVSESFPVSESELRANIQEAFSIWEKYYFSHYPSVYEKQKFGRQIDFNVKLLERCDGSEALKFYFGVEDAAVLSAKDQFQDPLALSFRTSYDTVTGFGRGLIWVQTPGKSDIAEEYKKDFIFGLIAHELGHVMGCGHVSGTIMDEKVAEHFSPTQWRMDDDFIGRVTYQMPVEQYHWLVRSIDYQRQLSLDTEGLLKSGGFEGYPNEINQDAFNEDAKLLMGRAASGNVQMFLDAGAGSTMTLTFKDDVGAVSVKIVPRTLEGVESGDEARVFTILDQGLPQWFFGGQLMIGDADIQTAQGQVIPARIMFNVGNTWVVELLRRSDDLDTRTIFRSYPRLAN